MEPNQKIPIDLLDRFLAGELSPAESEEAGRTENSVALGAMRRVRPVPDVAPIVVDTRSAWERFCKDAKKAYQTNAEGMTSKTSEVRGTSPASTQKDGVFYRLSVPRWVGYSISVAALLVLGYVYIPSISNIRDSKSVQRTYKTSNSQRASIMLADGSNVILAPASVLRVTGRSIELEGEAIFTVTANSEYPFTVRAGNSVTRVLGTTFGVRAYPLDKSVKVIVAVGRVSVASAILAAGDVASLPNGSVEPVVTSGADVSSAFAWTSDKLVFNNTPLPEVIKDLERWYDMRFVLSDSVLANSSVTTSLSTQSLNEVLRILSTILNANASRTSSTVTFNTR